MLFKSTILNLVLLLPSTHGDGLRGAPHKEGIHQQEHSSTSSSIRHLSSEILFAPLSCNNELDVSKCNTGSTLSSILSNADTSNEVKIPCGICALVDTTDGSTVAIPSGLNIEGMLYFPSSSNVIIETTHIFVQGKLKMDPPAPTSSNSIRIRMVGGDDQYLHPHEENAASCDEDTGCSVGKKAIIVAGGQLDINGLYDSDCPSFTHLKALPSATQIQVENTKDPGTPVFIQFEENPIKTATDCWGVGDEILITNSKGAIRGWMDQLVRTITAVDKKSGILTVSEDIHASPVTTEMNPDFASEVASLSRKIVFEAEGDGPSDATYSALHGGHLMIFNTPDVAQRLEGVEIRNFGQQGNLGRYPIHFHMSNRVTGSIVRKNVIRESKQRCVVIHGSHDVIIEDNVAFDSYGHCYTLEDGAEMDNQFIGNLGARTRGVPAAVATVLGSSDSFGSTFWITNTKNHFIGNVAAGSRNSGFWFELRDVRGISNPLYPDVNPRVLPLYTFRENTSHSNSDMGIRTYAPGWKSPTEALFQSIKSYQNRWGIFLHGTQNVRINDALIAHHEKGGVLYFGNGNANIIEDSTIIGSCGKTGIFFSLEPTAHQIEVRDTSFFGFAEGCEDNPGVALSQGSTQAKSAYGMPIFTNLSFDSNAVDAVSITKEFGTRSIFFEDPDGGMNPSGEPGFFVNNVDYNKIFLDDQEACSTATKGSGLFCQNICMRRVEVRTGCCSKKFELPANDYKMVVTSVTDPTKSFTFEKYVIHAGLWKHANKFIFALPSGNYRVHFIDENDGSLKVPSVGVEFDRAPSCTDYVTDNSLDITCPPTYELGDDGLTCQYGNSAPVPSTPAPVPSTPTPIASTSNPSTSPSTYSY